MYNPQSGLLPLAGEDSARVATPSPTRQVERSAENASKSSAEEGLASLAANTLGQHVGIVCVIKTIPDIKNGLSDLCKPCQNGFVYSFGVILRDKDGSMCNAIVNDAVGSTLFGMSATEAVRGAKRGEDIINESLLWKATVQSVEWRSARYFILLDICTSNVVDY
jgi:hypothetical protein